MGLQRTSESPEIPTLTVPDDVSAEVAAHLSEMEGTEWHDVRLGMDPVIRKRKHLATSIFWAK